ncbi:MAG: FkbM family methyltransferase, partial [Chitinophagaceae bacterium]
MNFKNKLNKFLRKYNVEVHGLSYLQALSKGEFKNSEIDLIKKIYGDANIIVYDIGGNKGTTIQSFLQTFPNSTIHAFEPYLPLFKILKEQFDTDKNVFINQQAISNMEGEVIFNVNKSIDTNSLLSSKKTGLNSDKQVETMQQVNVNVTTIGDYAIKHEHSMIHVCKIDIQGNELKALKGAELLLREGRIDLVFTEAYFLQQYQDQPLFFEIAAYLLSFGYV